MWHFMQRGLRMLAVLAVATIAARTAVAQTPEGTVIRNIATVTFTDANSNAYAAVADTVEVTVGFAAGIDARGVATVTPASPSTGNTMTFSVVNMGNGTDTMAVSEAISVAGVITVTGYVYNGTPYADLAALNAALASVGVAAGDSIVIEVTYSVPSGFGGDSTDYTLTGTSGRSGSVSDAQVTAVQPTETFGVAVTPDGSQNLQQLPTGSASPYQFTFTVTNNGNGAEDFDLAASVPGTAITIVSVNGVAGTTATLSALAAGASVSVVVEYTIGDVAAGMADSVYLAATAVGNPATTDNGYADLTVIRPTLAIVKQAWLADRSAQISGDVLPGDTIEYRVEVTNNGGAPAASVVVTDALPAEVAFVSTDDPVSAWASIGESGGTVTATLGSALPPGSSVYFWVRVRVL